jgi:hypothetical protein
MTELVAIVLAASIGAVSGILSASWKTRKDLEAQYDIDLRKRRIDAYRALWKELDVLADYSPPGPLTYEGLQTLSVALRKWYFERGGLFLSLGSRGPYFNLQQALTAISGARDGGATNLVDDETATIVKTLGSRLRTSTTDDVATRVGSRLGPSLLTRLGRRWWRLRQPIWAGVDRRWAWEQGRPEPCYFVVIQNRSDREVEVADLAIDDVPNPVIEPSLPLLVQAGEPRELAVKPTGDQGVVGRVARLTITLEGGRRIKSRTPPDVPIRTDALKLGRRQREAADSPG